MLPKEIGSGQTARLLISLTGTVMNQTESVVKTAGSYYTALIHLAKIRGDGMITRVLVPTLALMPISVKCA